MSAKRLISEADVRALPRGGELVLGPDVLATPSALDLAFERGLKIVRSASVASSECAAKSSCGCGGACGGNSGGCTWSKMMQQDATYVVVVTGGKASVARMTPQGPVPFS
ncbi:MAG: hypothetical protein IT454_08525 [Planctomycetes bacterium]|nr:hypothetical protein [Planctomycetota bacterium]